MKHTSPWALQSALAWIVPSVCYETFARKILEGFACRLPVVAGRLGAMAELVNEGVTGLLFNPGDPEDLGLKLASALAHPDQMRRMGEAAFAEYERKYSPLANYEALMAIYGDVNSRA